MMVAGVLLICQSQTLWPDAEPPTPANGICRRFYTPFADSTRLQYAAITDRLISRYGDYRSSAIKGHRHAGIDLHGKYSEPVYAVGAGTVEGIYGGFPNRVLVIKHYLATADSVYSAYTHIEEVRVQPGDYVDQDTCLGRIFNAEELQRSNFNCACHLHLEIRKSTADKGRASWQSLTMAALDKYCLDPEEFLPQYMK